MGRNKGWADPGPRYENYPDKGCELHPSCLNCSEAKCYLDWSLKEKATLRNPERDRQVIKAVREGYSLIQIAERYGISIRTIRRIIKKGGS